METEQLNKAPLNQIEEHRNVAEGTFSNRMESQLLLKVRQNFGVFGCISLIFGVVLTLLFYEAGFGLNNLFFTLVMVILLRVTAHKLSLERKAGTYFYYAGALLLALSSTVTSNETLHFLNTIGILLLLDLSLLQQLYQVKDWDFAKHFIRMFGLPFACIAALGMPFIDSVNFMRHTKVFKNDKFRNVFIGILISVPFLWIVTALLASADLLFGKLTRDIFDIIFSEDIIAIILITAFGFLACYCIICGSVSGVGVQERKVSKKADASIAITFMAILSLVYLVFCVIQLAYLFSNGLFVLPAEFTYAEYARRGFFELLAVAIMNVSLMLICKAVFHENRVLRLIVTAMTLCTYIMIASATYRMLLYISVYHLTFLRVFVLLSLLVIALVLGGIIIAEYYNKFPLFQYCALAISVCYILFSFSKPDYYIAEYLVDHKPQLDHEDIAFLTYDLSLDAAPVVLPLLVEKERYSQDKTDLGNEIRDYVPSYEDTLYLITNYYQKIEAADSAQDVRGFNYSKYLAKKYTVKYPINDE